MWEKEEVDVAAASPNALLPQRCLLPMSHLLWQKVYICRGRAALTEEFCNCSPPWVRKNYLPIPFSLHGFLSNIRLSVSAQNSSRDLDLKSWFILLQVEHDRGWWLSQRKSYRWLQTWNKALSLRNDLYRKAVPCRNALETQPQSWILHTVTDSELYRQEFLICGICISPPPTYCSTQLQLCLLGKVSVSAQQDIITTILGSNT